MTMESLKENIIGILEIVAPQTYEEYMKLQDLKASTHPFPDIDFEDLAEVPADRLREFIDWYGQGLR